MGNKGLFVEPSIMTKAIDGGWAIIKNVNHPKELTQTGQFSESTVKCSQTT